MTDQASTSRPLLRKPEDSDFKQQRLKAWQPLLTPNVVIPLFYIFAVLFLPIGVAIIYTSEKIVETNSVSYQKCDGVCQYELKVTDKMNKPVYMYYEMTKFYQNHRRYVGSRSDDQLRGEIVESAAALEYCDPLIKPKGLSDGPENFYNPCGLIANSWFNDTFNLFLDTEEVRLNKTGISWESDREVKFKNPEEYEGVPPPNYPNKDEFTDYENEHFIVWMRTAALPRFKKLYAKIDRDLEPGTYKLIVNSTFDVSSFGGTKAVVLSTADWIGGKNFFLGWAYISMSIISFFFGSLFFFLKYYKPRKLGDTQYLVVKRQS